MKKCLLDYFLHAFVIADIWWPQCFLSFGEIAEIWCQYNNFNKWSSLYNSENWHGCFSTWFQCLFYSRLTFNLTPLHLMCFWRKLENTWKRIEVATRPSRWYTGVDTRSGLTEELKNGAFGRPFSWLALMYGCKKKLHERFWLAISVAFSLAGLLELWVANPNGVAKQTGLTNQKKTFYWTS